MLTQVWHCVVWEFHAAWHSNIGLTSDISLGRSFLFIWPIEDKGSVCLKPIWKVSLFVQFCLMLVFQKWHSSVLTLFTVRFSIQSGMKFFFFFLNLSLFSLHRKCKASLTAMHCRKPSVKYLAKKNPGIFCIHYICIVCMACVLYPVGIIVLVWWYAVLNMPMYP